MSDEEELRLKAFGLIQADSSPAHLRELVDELGVPYSRLIKWRKELETATEEGNIAELVNVDQLMLHRIAEETKQDLEALAPTEGELIEAEVGKVTDGIDGLQVLGDQLQVTALKLAKKIDNLTTSVIEPKDIAPLVDSLSKIQIAFFNKQTATVNVQNNNYSSDGVSKFAGLEKKA